MENTKHSATKSSLRSVWLPFLGSMNLAVTLLMMLAIASVIGTVLKQDQSVQDYIIKFGPFWAEVFGELGLFRVYGAAWFVLVLLFLLLSTATCVVRHTPTFTRDMKQYSETLSVRAYQHQPYHVQLTDTQFNTDTAQALLKSQGYKTKVHQRQDGMTVAGMKGHWNRLGYFFTHISIIIICIGGLLDSNLLLKSRELSGDLVPETRAVPLAEIPQESWLGPENFSFRGSVNIPEGKRSDVLFLPYDDGFLVQKLPFMIEVTDFRVEFYDTGMPKSFESDLILTDPELDEPIKQTIAVNYPLFYKNYAIYQSSFGDGGSELKVKVYPLLSPTVNPVSFDSAVEDIETLNTPVGAFKIEFNDFKLFNVVPTSEEEQALTGKKVHNNGPTMIFKVRNDQGVAWEYENYMAPNKQDDRWFFMSGMRKSVAEPYRYVFIPADAKRTKERFFKFLALINNKAEMRRIFQQSFPKTADMTEKNYNLQMRLLEQLVSLFRQQGFNGISNFVEKSVPEEERERVSEYYFSQSSLALQTLYLHLLAAEAPADQSSELTAEEKQWFEDAITAVSAFTGYGPPMFVELNSFKHIESTGLQITKSPGKDIVYFGSTLLIIGVFFLFYVRQKRVWLAYTPADQTLTLAGKDTKELPETAKEFENLTQLVKQTFISQPQQQVKHDDNA